MESLPLLCVAVPLLVAAGLAAVGRWLPRPVVDVVSLLSCLGVLGLGVTLLVATGSRRVVSWVAGYTPHGGASVGVVFVVDRVGAGLAVLVAALMTGALLYTWRYFSEVESKFHVLMLLFLAGMAGFALTGDLFDAFVFFELMGAVAYALTGYKIEEAQPLQGALNFAVVNSLGAYCTLLGIGLLYGRTGELGFAQIHQALAGHGPPDALVVVGAALVLTGFLVKAAAVPFHFWLADAHAVAPSPVCVLFSGVMVELGLYGVARTWSAALSAALPAERLRPALLVGGVVTALVASVMCLAQTHLKRLLAFSTMAHMGLFLVALGALEPASVGGLLVYVLGHAGVKGALFLCAGLLLNHHGSLDAEELYGRGREMPVTRVCFLVGALALAGLPPSGTWLGKTLSEDGLSHAGYGWAPALFVATSALTGAAVLRVGLQIFLGVGERPGSAEDTRGRHEDSETGALLSRLPATMVGPAVTLLGVGVALGMVPGLGRVAEQAAQTLLDGGGYAAATLHGAVGVHAPASDVTGFTASGVVLGLVSVALALAVAAAQLYSRRLPAPVRAVGVALRPPLRILRATHSGHLGDYVVWLLLGVTLLAGAIAVS